MQQSGPRFTPAASVKASLQVFWYLGGLPVGAVKLHTDACQSADTARLTVRTRVYRACCERWLRLGSTSHLQVTGKPCRMLLPTWALGFKVSSGWSRSTTFFIYAWTQFWAMLGLPLLQLHFNGINTQQL